VIPYNGLQLFLTTRATSHTETRDPSKGADAGKRRGGLLTPLKPVALRGSMDYNFYVHFLIR
jgi:hypothetical protein